MPKIREHARYGECPDIDFILKMFLNKTILLKIGQTLFPLIYSNIHFLKRN